jgi:hypothetical protein
MGGERQHEQAWVRFPNPPSNQFKATQRPTACRLELVGIPIMISRQKRPHVIIRWTADAFELQRLILRDE